MNKCICIQNYNICVARGGNGIEEEATADNSYLIDAQVITDNGNQIEVDEIHELLHENLVLVEVEQLEVVGDVEIVDMDRGSQKKAGKYGSTESQISGFYV